MATDYTEFVSLAQELIEENGRSCALLQLSGAAADPSKPWNGPGTPTIAQRIDDVFMCFVPASGADLGKSIATPELLARCDQVALCAASTSYAGFHAVEDGGERWKIEWCQVLKPGPVEVLYAFGVKR